MQKKQKIMIDLNGEWTVRGAEFVAEGLNARVPGCIHEDLLRNGLPVAD